MASLSKITWLKRNRRDSKSLKRREKRLRLINIKLAEKRVPELKNIVVYEASELKS